MLSRAGARVWQRAAACGLRWATRLSAAGALPQGDASSETSYHDDDANVQDATGM